MGRYLTHGFHRHYRMVAAERILTRPRHRVTFCIDPGPYLRRARELTLYGDDAIQLSDGSSR